jgi:hypothetical protein
MINTHKIVKISIIGIDETTDSQWFEIRFLNIFGIWKTLKSSDSTRLDFVPEVLKFPTQDAAEEFFATNIKSKKKAIRIEENVKYLSL